jgi:hypothetical protein
VVGSEPELGDEKASHGPRKRLTSGSEKAAQPAVRLIEGTRI